MAGNPYDHRFGAVSIGKDEIKRSQTTLPADGRDGELVRLYGNSILPNGS